MAGAIAQYIPRAFARQSICCAVSASRIDAGVCRSAIAAAENRVRSAARMIAPVSSLRFPGFRAITDTLAAGFPPRAGGAVGKARRKEVRARASRNQGGATPETGTFFRKGMRDLKEPSIAEALSQPAIETPSGVCVAHPRLARVKLSRNLGPTGTPRSSNFSRKGVGWSKEPSHDPAGLSAHGSARSPASASVEVRE
jgi:hypothetical protein